MDQCATSPVVRSKQACCQVGLVLMVRTFIKVSTFNLTRPVMWTTCFKGLRNSVNPFVIFEQLSSSLPKCHNIRVSQLTLFYNRILKLACQCEFSDINERLIDDIIFGTNCVKAQDKLLQMAKTLILQQCLTVCHHYEV